MLGEIIIKEILESIKSPKMTLTFLICTILIMLTVFVGAKNYRIKLQEYKSDIAYENTMLKTYSSEEILQVRGKKVIKSPQVLSIIVTGIEEAIGNWATSVDENFVSMIPDFSDSKYTRNPTSSIFGEFDIILIVKIVISLLAILFTFDAIVGEKERGTLKQIFSNSQPRDILIIGKVIGSFFSFLIPFIVAFLLGMLLLIIYPDISLTNEEWKRIGLIFILFIFYLMVFFTLGLFISSRTSRSSSSILILLFIWAVLVFVIPKSFVAVAEQIHPLPSKFDIEKQKSDSASEIFKSFNLELKSKKLQEKYSEDIKKYNDIMKSKRGFKDLKEYDDIIKSNPGYEEYKKLTSALIEEMQAQIKAKNKEIDDSYNNKYRRQQTLAVYLSRLSPASVLSYASMSLGRSGIEEHERFVSSVDNYKKIYTEWLDKKRGRKIPMVYFMGIGPNFDIDDMPQFEFKPESLRVSFTRAIPDFVILILMSIIFFTGAFVSFLRYDVR